MLSFSKAKSVGDRIDEAWVTREKLSVGDFIARSNLYFVKTIWDNYKMPDGMVESDTLINLLKVSFPDVESARVCRPLGDFKDFYDMSCEEIYDAWVDSFTQLRVVSDGGMRSFINVMFDSAVELSARLQGVGSKYNSHKYFSRESFELGLSIMLYKCSLGVMLEAKTVRYFEKVYESNPLVFFSAAPTSMERDDVDAVLYSRDSEEVLVKISIKCLGALSDKSLSKWRAPKSKGGKGKSIPEVYMGYHSEFDVKPDVKFAPGISRELLLARR